MVDYTYYTDTYHGKTIPADDFPGAELRATAYVYKITFGRADDSAAAKNAVCAVADVFYKAEENDGISSENNDGYSVTYIKTSNRQILTTAYQAAKLYLPSALLYRGCDG